MSSGSWSAHFGGSNNVSDAIEQTVNVPTWANTAAIYFDWRMYSSDSLYTPYDALGVGVGKSGTLIASTFVNNTATTGTWYTRRLSLGNVAAYRGQPLDIVILGTTDGSNPTTWYVDNVQLWFACGNRVAGQEAHEGAGNVDEDSTGATISSSIQNPAWQQRLIERLAERDLSGRKLESGDDRIDR